MSFAAAVHAKAIQLDRASLETTAAAGAGHPTSAMSLGHIVTVLMYHSMRWVPSHPRYPSSDRLVLSEGHAVPIIYAACADLGVGIGKEGELRPMTMEDAMTLRDIDSPIDGHPNPMEGFPFFDAATGSLGMGLSVAAGLGLAARRDEINKQIYCIIGDGESREGQIWEAIDFIMDHKLSNVVPIFNCNSYAQAGKVSEQQSSGVTAKKLEAAGFIAEVIDGHAPEAIRAALESAYWRAVAEATVGPYHGATVRVGSSRPYHGAPSLPFCVDDMRMPESSLLSPSAVLVLLPHLSDWTEDEAVCAAVRECLIDALCPTLPTLPTDEQVTSTICATCIDPSGCYRPLRSLPAC